MPLFAQLATPPIPCPACDADLTVQRQLGFQWGHCCHSHGCGTPDYKIGDAIKWRRAMDGTVPAWVYFRGHTSANIGDPAHSTLIVRESEFDTRICSACNTPFAGFAITIVDGVIRSAEIACELQDDVDITLVNEDGSMTPMPDWNDHLMPDVVRGALSPKFFTVADL